MQSYLDKSDDYFSHARQEILPLLPPNCGRVLELGCGSGATLGWLKQTQKSVYTVGIEIAEAAAIAARARADSLRDAFGCGAVFVDVVQQAVHRFERGVLDLLVAQFSGHGFGTPSHCVAVGG